jgi:enoyl-CoA hydratase
LDPGFSDRRPTRPAEATHERIGNAATVSGGVNDILFERRGTAGLAILNRPTSLNALTHTMVNALAGKLSDWADDPAVTRVIVTAAGDRAFCAGGDLRALYDLHRAGRQGEARAFWRDEYRLDALIKHYRKPYVAVIDGVAMGGGAGISIHGSHRVAGDRFEFAMPEVGIGFFPDVGASWFLARLPAETGTFLALTGERLGAADAVSLGLVTHRVGTARLPELISALCGSVSVDALLGAFAEPVGQSTLAARLPAVGRLFEGDTVEDILAALDAEDATAGSPDAAFARAAAASIRSKSPTSLKIALSLLRRGRDLEFDECMRMEYRIVSRLVMGHDFYEGIRALIVDKDRTPRWRPSSLAEVGAAEVAAHFAPLAVELDLP